MSQIEQDTISLDYSRWSFEQPRANLPNDHNLWQQVRDRTLARQKSDNAEARRKYIAKLDDEQKARQAERDAENKPKQIAAEASLKSSLKASYMANPAASDEDFERDYPQLKSEYLRGEAMRNDAIARQSQARAMQESF
ncbi:MAG: hypothetical protein M3Q99_10035 [Acidobacteriota bacterium]|nr:hypothetical protein [Acidobacteriota bacterium]